MVVLKTIHLTFSLYMYIADSWVYFVKYTLSLEVMTLTDKMGPYSMSEGCLLVRINNKEPTVLMLKENWPYREEAFLTKRPYETGDILIFINTLKCCGVGYQSTK